MAFSNDYARVTSSIAAKTAALLSAGVRPSRSFGQTGDSPSAKTLHTYALLIHVELRALLQQADTVVGAHCRDVG